MFQLVIFQLARLRPIELTGHERREDGTKQEAFEIDVCCVIRGCGWG